MNTEKLSNENKTEALNKHSIMQAGSEKQPYFKLSTNEFGKHWLFYKPLKSEPGKYGCWMPVDDEFYSEFNKLQKAALGSEATVASRSVGAKRERRDDDVWNDLGNTLYEMSKDEPEW